LSTCFFEIFNKLGLFSTFRSLEKLSQRNMMKEIYAIKSLFLTATLALGCTILSACSSDSSTDPEPQDPEPTITGQAIDGYIVGGTVFCDGVENGFTGAAGRYSCPNGTKVVRVQGGVDVGFDQAATTSTVSFNGVLVGSGSYKYITPVTTLAIELSGGEENYDASRLNSSIEAIKKVLNIEVLDPNQNPAENIAMARLNAQLHLIVGTLSSTRDEYKKVMGSLADLIESKAESSETINVNGSDETKFSETMQDLNNILIVKHSEITVNIDIEIVIVFVLDGVKDLENIETTGGIKPKPALSDYALTFSTTQGLVNLTSQDDVTFSYDVTDYENDNRNGQGKYVAVLNRGIKRISLDKSLIDVKKTLTDESVDVAFSIQGDPKIGDPRELNVIARDIKVSMVKGDSSSIKVKIPDGTIWRVEGTSVDGTITQVDVEKDGDRIFSSNNDGINLDFDYVSDELHKKGHPDLTREIGNFRITYIISGLALGRTTDTEKKSAGVYIVDIGNDDDHLAGQGLRGFVTVQE